MKVIGQYATLYDQAGLMVRVDETTWIKCGIEYVDGVQHVSAVVTRDFSDWSVVPLPSNPEAIWLRLTRTGSAIEISYALDGSRYTLLRLAYLAEAEPLQIGVMCAAPQGEGFSGHVRASRVPGAVVSVAYSMCFGSTDLLLISQRISRPMEAS